MPPLNSSKNSKGTKFVFISGGVISGLGKGISTASIALLLKELGYKVTVLKVDMYLNLDAGTINPMEHGEVFVTADGMETDQDLGNYERFLNQDFLRRNYMTMGQIYYDVITRERKLGYGGQDVEGHIHVPEEIIRRIKDTAKKDDADIMFIEVGGTVGEYQNMMFFEAIRRFKQQSREKGKDSVFLMHLVYLPKPKFLGEVKSKPAQSAIYELYRIGLRPNFVICRSENSIDEQKKSTLAFNTGVDRNGIIAAPDVETIYEMPLVFKKQRVGEKLLKEMGLKPKQKASRDWANLVKTIENVRGNGKKKVKIAIVGKYFNFGDSVLEDAYICVLEAIKHASWQNKVTPEIQWFDVERFENEKERPVIKTELAKLDGIIVPQGWGSRGVEGKIRTVQFAREKKIPYVGLCFGMQMAVIEFARNVLGLAGANSEEVNSKTKHPVVHMMPNQKEYLAKKRYGGTIRLGAWPCKLKEGSLLKKAYQEFGPNLMKNGIVQERHRHRYEVNNDYKKQLERQGMIISGTSPDGMLCEAVELDQKQHPFFVATQYHPEYQSRPLQPHPVFCALIKAALKPKKKS